MLIVEIDALGLRLAWGDCEVAVVPFDEIIPRRTMISEMISRVTTCNHFWFNALAKAGRFWHGTGPSTVRTWPQEQYYS